MNMNWWKWIDANDMQACYPWPGDTTQQKEFAESTQFAFGVIKGSSLRCFGDSPKYNLVCVGLCGVHISLDKFEDKGKIFQHYFRIYRLYEMGVIALFMIFTRTSVFIAWSRSYAVPFTVRSSKRGRWVSAWSTRGLNTTTTWYRAWLPVPPFRPLTVNCAFNSTCISEGHILKSRESE